MCLTELSSILIFSKTKKNCDQNLFPLHVWLRQHRSTPETEVASRAFSSQITFQKNSFPTKNCFVCFIDFSFSFNFHLKTLPMLEWNKKPWKLNQFTRSMAIKNYQFIKFSPRFVSIDLIQFSSEIFCRNLWFMFSQ